MKRIALIALLLLMLSCAFAEGIFHKYYLPGYYPFIYNQYDIYKINNGLNLHRANPYLVNKIGPATEKSIELESNRVAIFTKVGDELLVPEVTISLDDYLEGVKAHVFRTTLTAQVLTIQQVTTTQTSGLIKDISIDLPNIAIPKTLRRILGNKAGRLNLDGTQRITLSGTSTKRKIIPIYESNRGARFDLRMQQESNLRLSGTIGEKITVNMKYNSNQDETLFDPNNVNLKYTGDEDEIVQSIEAGNIALSLSGSRYISYSTSSQGLFGVTAKMKVNALDLTLIASKEEGQKNTRTYIGQSQADSTIIYSKNYSARNFYFLEKPLDIYNLYTQNDLSVPEGWRNNAIKTTAGDWQIAYPALLPKNGTVRVYLDDGDATNNVASNPGDPVFTSLAESYIPYYDELIEGTDFITNYSIGTIEILKNIDRRYTVAVQYTRKDEILVPENNNILDGILHAKVIRTKNQEYSPSNPYSTWDYQMRNIYSMGISNIKKDDFKLEVYTENTDRTRNFNVPDSLSFPGIITYNDYLRLDTSGDGKVDGDDSTVNLVSGYIIMPLINPFSPLGDTLIYQDENESINYDEFKHFISVYGKIGRDQISLGQSGILENSVTVKVNGNVQKENVDYLVNYDMGQITFLSAAGKDPDAKIEIDYEYRSGFAVASKSLVGIRADLNITENTKIGGTAIYRTETVNEKRPKIGNENMRLFLADVDGSASWKPGFITRWLDALPILKTTTESRITLSGEVALTIPDISGDDQHENEAYIDDMEGIIDSYPLGLSFSTWVMASKPWQVNLPKGRINWYNPLNVKMRQVYDESTLNDSEKDENITVLAMKLFPNNLQQPGLESWCYNGIMKYLGNQLDFSDKKYIELLVKVDKYADTIPNVTLHIDLGDINEDFYTEYGGMNFLNTEDKNNDGELTVAEDTGLDGIADGNPGDDPNDNAIIEDANADGDYPHKNGTENNNLLDTEDLDNNGVLNQLDRYLSYSVSLTNLNQDQNTYLIDYITSTKYMLIRIPLNDISPSQIVNNSTSGVQPSLNKISYARIWAETDKTARILIASATVVGNKWVDFNIRYQNDAIIPATILNSNNESYLSGIADNQKTSHYTSPRNTFYTEYDKPSLEQSLTLEVFNLKESHKVLLRQRLIDYYSLLSYQKIRLWVYPENSQSILYYEGDSLDVIFRMGADSLNYYQVRQPVKILDYHTANNKMQLDWWIPLEYSLQDFSKIKDSLAVEEEYSSGGAFFAYKGSPTLTNIREFCIGVQRRDKSNTPFSGIVYFNDIRVAEPFEDIGLAGRLTLNSVFADFSTLDVEFERKSENFNTNIQRGRTQTVSFASTNNLKINNTYSLDKFFPSVWGLRIPLSLDRNYSISYPRYRANSDILRSSILDQEDKEREKSETLAYTANIGISQTVQPKSRFLAYTLNRMSLSGRLSSTINQTATIRDTTLAWQGTYNYNVNLPDDLLKFKLIKSYRIRLIPSSFTNNFTLNSSDPKSYNWEKRDTLSTWFPRAQTYPTKILNTDNGITWSLTPDFDTTYRLMTKRDLKQIQYFHDINIGKETEYKQTAGVNYAPDYIPSLLNFSSSLSSTYTENQRKYSEYLNSEEVITYYRDGNADRTIRMNLTLMNSNLLNNLKNKLNTSVAGKKPSDDKKTQMESGMIKPSDKEEFSEEENTKLEELPLYEEKKHKDIEESLSEEERKKLEEIRSKENEKSLLQEGKQRDNNDFGQDDLKPQDGNISSLGKVNYTQEQIDSLSSKAKINLPFMIIDWLAHVKNINATYQNGYAQLFTSKFSRPNFAFQLGLPNQVPLTFLDSRNNENTYTLSSGIAFSRRLDSVMNFSYSNTLHYASASNQVIATTFPDVTLTVTELESILGLSRFLNDTRLNTSTQYTLRQNGDINWIKPKQETKTWAFNPLASITTRISGQIQTTLSYTMNRSTNFTDMDTYMIVRKSNSGGLTGNLSYSFKADKGIKLPFSDKKINIKNELTSSLSLSYQQNYDTTKGSGDTQIDVSSYRVSISPSATYQFDQNIRGGLNSSYDITRDKKRDDRVRIFQLGIWIEINL